MNLIDLDDKLTFNLTKLNIEDYYSKYVGEVFTKFNYNIKIVDSVAEKHANCVSDFVQLLNRKLDKFTVLLDEIFPNKIFMFYKDKEFVESETDKDFILSLVFEIPHFLTVAKRVKTVLDTEKQSIEKTGLFKDGFISFNLKGIEIYADEAIKHALDLHLSFSTFCEDGNLKFKIPLERLLLLNYSEYDVTVILHTIMSLFKYLYSIEVCGKEFLERLSLKGELDKWKITAKKDIEEIMKHRG